MVWRDHIVCPITAAAVLKAGMDLEEFVHFSDTQVQWTRQLLDASLPSFDVPAGGPAPNVDSTDPSYSAIKLTAQSETPMQIWLPPVVPNPRGRPKTQRQERLINPKKPR